MKCKLPLGNSLIRISEEGYTGIILGLVIVLFIQFIPNQKSLNSSYSTWKVHKNL